MYQDLGGSNVPDVRVVVDHRADAAFGRQGMPEAVAIGSHAVMGLHQVVEQIGTAGLDELSAFAAGDDLIGNIVRRHVGQLRQDLAVTGSAQPVGRDVDPVQARQVDDANHRPAAMDHSQQGAVQGDAVSQALGAVDGVDDPEEVRGADGPGAFLAKDIVGGIIAGDAGPDEVLDREIDVGHEGAVGFAPTGWLAGPAHGGEGAVPRMISTAKSRKDRSSSSASVIPFPRRRQIFRYPAPGLRPEPEEVP